MNITPYFLFVLLIFVQKYRPMSILIQDFQQNFGFYWSLVLQGEHILLIDNQQIVAVLKPYNENIALRPSGLAKGKFVVPSDFNTPLPEEELTIFYQ